MDWPLLLGLAGVALLTSLVTGTLGAGGGILIIPLVLYVLTPLLASRLDAHQVTSLALVQGIAATVGGGIGYQRRGQIERRELLFNAPPLALFGLAGALLSARLGGRALLLVFAVATSLAALLLVTRPREGTWPPGPRRRAQALLLLAGVGLLGGIIGVGGAFLTIPVLTYVIGVPVRMAAGTGLVLSLCLALPALVGKAITGQVAWVPAAAVAAAGLVGSSLGSALSNRLPTAALRGGLALLVAGLALRTWVDVLG